ncbi:MAG: NAD-dependent epimerase/dehydratase family protein [Candidatus Omnitrophota bacterium]|nr:MAG: NAD-dependent epimerase/dehydratase family protein [Candidatus Omnitrophota bacterium]
MKNLEKYYKGKSVLITGGLGFIGSTLAQRLVKLKSSVTIVDSLIPQYGGNMFNIHQVKNKVKINFSDVRDKYSMNFLIKDKDLLFNLAGTLSHIDSMTDPFTDLEVNCAAQLAILEACRNYNPGIKIIFAGTRSQYGRPEYLPVDEKHPLKPADVNGINNIAGESYHLLYNEVYGIKACSLRLTNTFGPRHQMHHHRQGIINWLIRQVIDGNEVKLYGDGAQVRDVSYVDDVVDAFIIAMARNEANGQVFNLGGTPISLEEITRLIIKINKKGSYRIVPYPSDIKKIEVGNYVADYGKIKDMLGWFPQVSLEDGIRRTLAFYKKYKRHYW